MVKLTDHIAAAACEERSQRFQVDTLGDKPYRPIAKQGPEPVHVLAGESLQRFLQVDFQIIRLGPDDGMFRIGIDNHEGIGSTVGDVTNWDADFSGEDGFFTQGSQVRRHPLFAELRARTGEDIGHLLDQRFVVVTVPRLIEVKLFV